MARKGENIYKRKYGRWEGRYIKSRSPAGKVKYGYVYAQTYREAKTKLKSATMMESKPPVSTKDATDLFEQAAAEWLDATKPFVKESTSNRYQNLLALYITPEIGKIPINRITHNTIESFANLLLQTGGAKHSGLSAKTVSDVLSVIRSVLRYCSKKGKIISYDAYSIQIKQHQKEMRVLSRSEQEKLCKYLYSDLNACNMGILVCLFTGLRVGEICALQWEDISFEDHTIHVHQTMQRVQNKTALGQKTKVIVTAPKSACSIRTIPIPDELFDAIDLYRTTGVGYFLTGSKHDYIEPRTMQNHFKQALRRCEVASANYHALRHTFATRCVELGFDVKSLSEILGHASVNITMNRYVHPSMELKKENMKRLSALLAVK